MRALLRRVVFALLVVVAFANAPAFAQAVPNAELQEVLIKVSLLSFNDANLTGNYVVFHAKLSKPFRDQVPPDKLSEAFKAFRDQHIDVGVIVAKSPIASEPPKVNDKGVLSLKGYFPTLPSRVSYDLAFIMSDGEWKLLGINVDVKPQK